MKTASIIIRTKNESRSLGATLAGIFDQDLAPHEVFVVDSGSRDETLEIAARYPAVQIMHISPREWNYSRAINIAAERATGEFLVCLSAHCPPVHRDWLRLLLSHLDDETVAAVWGPNISPGKSLPAGDPIRQEPGTYGVSNRRFGLVNSNSAVRRALWVEFRFDESLPATEDKAWAMEAMRRGYSIVHDPYAAVWHERHPAVNSFHRMRAIQAGYAALFPELHDDRDNPVKTLIFGSARKLRHLVVERDLKKFLHELRTAPPTIGAILGKFFGLRRR